MSKSTGVFIGRFQPFHLGHLFVVKEALKQVDFLLILIGSSNSPRTYHNPFSFQERKEMIRQATNSFWDRIIIRPLSDHIYNDEAWVENVQSIVVSEWGNENIYLVGHNKDKSSYYLKLFPQWKSIAIENYNGINSTDIRRDYFGLVKGGIASMSLPRPVTDFLIQFEYTKDYRYLKEETDFIIKYRNMWKNSPYPPTFVTVDACVIQSGHVLLVRRRSAPGKGLWALPGGYLNVQERILDGMIRELKEETKIKVPSAVLKGNIKEVKVFDAVNRSARGRIITHAHLIHLPPDIILPKVKGSDDADKAKWIPLAELNEQDLFEDHYAIIRNLTGTN